MKRWHEDRELMLRRWREEVAKHEDSFPRLALAPVPPMSDPDSCHCFLGMGVLRKRKPLDCGNPKCGVCHGEKFFAPKARDNARRTAIEFDLEAA